MRLFIEEAKALLRETRFRHAGEEQDLIEKLLKESRDEKDELIRWIFEDFSEKFSDPRVYAGRIYIKEHPNEGRTILEKLVRSENSDNREVAFDLLSERRDPEAIELIKLLLHEPHAGLRFEVCEYLKNIYSEDVKSALTDLLKDKHDFVRNQAQEKLNEMNK